MNPTYRKTRIKFYLGIFNLKLLVPLVFVFSLKNIKDENFMLGRNTLDLKSGRNYDMLIKNLYGVWRSPASAHALGA